MAAVPFPDMRAPRGSVLVVDDDPKFVRIIVRSLERAGYECRTASQGDEAIASASERATDAIVLDVMMPGLSGFEVCQRLRTEGSTAGIVIVSARTSSDDRAAATRAGADAFLAKPFDPVALPDRVEEILIRVERGEADAFRQARLAELDEP